MVLWNNVDLKSKGIIVEKTPNLYKGKKNYDTYSIEGRNDNLVIDKGTYNPFVVTIECHFDTDNFNINTIKSFLDGYGTISFDGETEYTAYLSNQIEFEKVTNFRKFPIQFTVNPIAKDITSTKVSNPTTITTTGTYQINPILTLVGSGDVSFTFNDSTFYLYDLDSSYTYTLDSELKELYNSNDVNCSSQMKGDFPILKVGTNTISKTGTITSYEIEYKNCYI